MCVSLVLAGGARAAILTVTSAGNTVADDGEMTLLEALTNLQDGDEVRFAIPGDGPHYLKTPEGGYPFITAHNVTINGYSQPGAAANSNPILAPNNAKLRIVLDSREGAGGINLASVAGFSASENAILAVVGARNFKVKGLAFLSHFTPANPDEPAIHCAALAQDATGGQISGCWFGLDPNGQDVSGGRSAVTSFVGDAGANASGLVLGTNGDGQDDLAEFNLFVGFGVAINLQTPNVKVSGNFINVLPDGKTFFDPLSDPRYADVGDMEAIENGLANNMVIGTDGDGRSDANERNIIGTVLHSSVVEFWASATNITFAGNYVGVGIDGQTTVANAASLLALRRLSDIQIGSDFDGVSDELEANRIYGLGGEFIHFHRNNGEAGGTVAARVSLRGNSLVNNLAPIPLDTNTDPNLDFNIVLLYSSVLLNSRTDFRPVLSTAESTATRLVGRIPLAKTAEFPVATVDLYLADPDGLTSGLAAGNPDGWVQGKSYLASFVEGAAADLDSEPGKFAFDLTALQLSGDATLVITANYSRDPAGTHHGRTVTSIFSNPVVVSTGPQIPLTIGSIVRNGSTVTINWSGGKPPFQLQKRASLTGGDWQDVGAPTSSTSASDVLSGDSAFYRVRGQ